MQASRGLCVDLQRLLWTLKEAFSKVEDPNKIFAEAIKQVCAEASDDIM